MEATSEAPQVDVTLANAPELQVAQIGQPGAMRLLRANNSPIEQVDDYVKALAWSLAKTMYSEPGVGLAAPQVGVNVRMVVVDAMWAMDPSGPQRPTFMINPEVVWASEERVTMEEGCLSVPGTMVKVARSNEVEVEYMDLEGNECHVAIEGWEARVVQHELDHLDGKLLIDYMGKVTKELYLAKARKRARAIKAAIKRMKVDEHSRMLQARRVERATSGHLPKGTSEDPAEGGTSGDGSGAGTPEQGLQYNQPEGN